MPYVKTHLAGYAEFRGEGCQPSSVIDRNQENTDTVHWRVADRLGGNIIIEIKNQGEISIHENLAGVITNSPDYEWHLTNLNNYINLEAGTVAQGQVMA
ncbi:linear amide C-N hydrolase [Escherichia coli]|uniref:linear amide C-N hydrolase n=1 Tax=Escherichia TaxID=561 RepID=UPI002452AE24|nr:linear amide C-N hydrolase [Escherichia coli]MCZ9249984.1 linear amide C-N hydrolase [Escherichia albertii]